MNLEKKYPEKRVLITGAGSGLGRALAIEFAKRKWNIIVADINSNRATETAQLADRYGGKALPVKCDVTIEKDCIALYTAIQKKYNGIDILINNAGVAAAGYFEKIPLTTWDWIYNINTKSIIIMCKTFIPMFKSQGYGYIVNIASFTGFASMPEMACYNMTKAATISLSETLYQELSPYNIHVSVACPSFFKTNLMDSFTSTDKRQEILAQKFFEKSFATVDDVAKHIIHSISREKLYIITQPDAKAVWWVKRHFPNFYARILSFAYRRGIVYMYLGVKPEELA
ncbi:MAG: SDR family NAD(P)-dependent oxidoreductase [Spirochaetes bacterium]|nr:SDR family NAD(P)-dependent oxidoreductase [Spirochaetota bacterium]